MKQGKTKKSVVVFYHDDHDGFGAAWAAWKKLKQRAVYVPIDHPVVFTHLKSYITRQSHVYFLDICPDKSVFRAVKGSAGTVTILDHHVSRKEIVLSHPGSVFDNNHSGAFLAWKYFHPSTRIPKIIQYIQDIDLWKWKLAGTEALLAALSWSFTFKHWNALSRILEDQRMCRKYIAIGKVMVRYKKKIIAAIIKDAEEVRSGKIRAFIVNAPDIIHSEVGHALTKKSNKAHVGITFSVNTSGSVLNISLRSDGKIDVSKIAGKYGGGGHKDAAAFIWPLHKPLPFKFVKNNG